ncbi:MAG: HRDC domain-containing protein [Oceanipulchritudo sp.]
MPYEFFQIPVSGQGAGKDDLNRTLRGGRIASVRKEFVAAGEQSFWAFCVEVLDAASTVAAGKGGRAEKVDYKQVLSEADFAVFSRLRLLRKELAEKEAIPAYSVFTNEQLSVIAKARPDSLAGIGKIPGIGEARVEKYGAAVLEALKAELPSV